MRQNNGHGTPTVTTTVYGHTVTITVELLSQKLHMSTEGREVMSENDFYRYHFSPRVAISRLSSIETFGTNSTNISCLPDELKVLHFYITRFFLPRTVDRSTVTPLDLWIMSNAVSYQKLSYPHLMFHHMMVYSNHRNGGYLPFAPQISRFLRCLGIDLEDKASSVNVLDTLRSQHVLRRVDASVGVRKLRSAQGGERAEEVRNTEADLAAVSKCLEGITKDTGKRKLMDRSKEEPLRPTTEGKSIRVMSTIKNAAAKKAEESLEPEEFEEPEEAEEDGGDKASRADNFSHPSDGEISEYESDPEYDF
ncbi:unnamed protein product [Linum trigynum]